MRGINHSEEDRRSDPLDIIRVFDAVNGGSPICTQAPHLARIHYRVRSVEPPVTDERKEGEGSLAKLEWLVVLEYMTDTANEWWVCRVEVLESFDGDGTGCVR